MSMLRKILLALLVLNSISFASPSVAILTSPQDNPQFVETLRRKLNSSLSADVFMIQNAYDIGKVLSRGPELAILVSDTTTKIYLKYVPNYGVTPTVLGLCNYGSYGELRAQVDDGVLLAEVSDADDLFHHLARFTGSLQPVVGYIYPNSYKAEALYEMRLLKEGNSTPYGVRMSSDAESGEILRDIRGLVNRGATVIRILDDGQFSNAIEEENDIREYLEDHTSVVVSNETDLFRALPNSAVVSVRRNSELMSSVIKVVAHALINTDEPRSDFTVTASAASLHHGTVRHYSLMSSRPFLLDSLYESTTLMDSMSSADSIWNLVYSTLAPVADADVLYHSELIANFEETSLSLDRVIFGTTTTVKDIILMAVGIVLTFILLMSVYRRHMRRRFRLKTAMVYPGKNIKRVLSNSNGKNRKLQEYLKREHFRAIKVHSLTHYDRRLKQYESRFHIIDWEKGSDAIQFLYNQLKKRTDEIDDTIVVYNISHKYQLEIMPRFEGISLHMIEKFPTVDDFNRVLYGEEHREIDTSYIAGQIDPDALPPIFQMLEVNKVNGVLLLEDPSPFAAIFYREGIIVYAENRLGTIGKDALFQCLSKTDGAFRFEKDRRSPVESLSIRSMNLLMEWSTQVDESDRG